MLSKQRKIGKVWLGLAALAFPLGLLELWAFWPRAAVPTESIQIRGNSLSPVWRDGDHVQFERIEASSLRRGDYVIVQLEEGRRIAKKLVALPGDQLELRTDYLYVNGAPVRNVQGQDYVLRSPVLHALVSLRPVLGPDEVFVLGEKFRGTYDSSVFYALRTNQILGRILAP